MPSGYDGDSDYGSRLPFEAGTDLAGDCGAGGLMEQQLAENRWSMSKIVAYCGMAIGVFFALSLAYIARGFAQDHSSVGSPELAFNDYCRECHAFDKGDNRLGPTLYGVFGRRAGSLPGYDFSISLKSSDVTWNEKTLDQWIADPNSLIPGNNMGSVYSGIPDAATRAKIIAFLKQDTETKK